MSLIQPGDGLKCVQALPGWLACQNHHVQDSHDLTWGFKFNFTVKSNSVLGFDSGFSVLWTCFCHQALQHSNEAVFVMDCLGSHGRILLNSTAAGEDSKHGHSGRIGMLRGQQEWCL